MKIIHLIFGISLFVVSFTNTTNAQNEEFEDFDYDIVDDVNLFDEIDFAFNQTYNAFQNGENAKAGARLKRAAYFVELESENVKVHNKKPIQNQANRLRSLADSLAMNKIQSAFTLRRAFARTHHILSTDYKLRAADYWAKKKAKETGEALIKAAGYLGHAAKWSGEKIEDGVVSIAKGTEVAAVNSVRGARWLGGKLVRGVGFVPRKVGEAIVWLGEGLDKVGQKIEPQNKNSKAQ